MASSLFIRRGHSRTRPTMSVKCFLRFEAPSRESELKDLGEKYGCKSPSEALEVTDFSPFSCYP
jgi:hypothetical protein